MKQHRVSAFSLVEVVAAVGLVGFALIAILAFFPAGLQSTRASADETRAAQIARAITGTIDAQCATFSNVNAYGMTLDLGSFTTTTAPTSLYASYDPLNQPVISNSNSGSIYLIELRFDNDPTLASSVKLGPGKTNLIQVRVYHAINGLKEAKASPIDFMFLARNKG